MKKIIKKNIFFGILLLTIGILNSCQDSLDIVQAGELDDEAIFTNVTNLNMYLKGDVYSSVEPNYEIYLSAVITDEVKPGKGSGGQEFQLHRLFMDSSTPLVKSIWFQHYKVINRVNRLLEGAKMFTVPQEEKELYNTIIAQARTLRAYSYLQLLAYFSTDLKNDNELGVMLFKDVPLTYVQTPRSLNKEVFDFIEEDLDFARSILNKETSWHYVDLNMVNAISARANVYRGNYELAKQYSLDLVNNSGLLLTKSTPMYPPGSTPEIGTTVWNRAFYSVESSFNPYRNLWNDSERGEIIFSAARQSSGIGFSIGTRWNTNSSAITGSPMWYWGRNLFNLFNKEGDIRRYAYVDPTSLIDPNYITSQAPMQTDALIIDKYPGKKNASTRNDIKIFRLSEIYFILAESEAELGNFSEAQLYIQKVREARNYNETATTPVYHNKQIALADILKERRIELALEGHRYIDLKRLAKDAGVSMDRNETDDNVMVNNLENNSYKYTLPIPLSEMTINNNMKQNPGY